MKVIKYPPKESWSEIVKRPVQDDLQLESTVADILADVRENGDSALRRYSKRFDNVDLEIFEVADSEIADAGLLVPGELKTAIGTAKANIEKFHDFAEKQPEIIETTPGVFCWRKTVADRKGRTLRSGRDRSAFLDGTDACDSREARGLPRDRHVLAARSRRQGRSRHFICCEALRRHSSFQDRRSTGDRGDGATEPKSVPKVYKIFGPGNQYVTEAKQQIARTGVAIDMPAGPSEVAVLADETANPAFVAADLLSQAEHGPDSQVILVSTSEISDRRNSGGIG